MCTSGGSAQPRVHARISPHRCAALTPALPRCTSCTSASTPLKSTFRGTIRREDIRATEKDKVEVYKSFRPGDIVLAKVISLGDMQSNYLRAQRRMSWVWWWLTAKQGHRWCRSAGVRCSAPGHTPRSSARWPACSRNSCRPSWPACAPSLLQGHQPAPPLSSLNQSNPCRPVSQDLTCPRAGGLCMQPAPPGASTGFWIVLRLVWGGGSRVPYALLQGVAPARALLPSLVFKLLCPE
uniref:Exosome complex component CSL4 C-terminal domain-containing protein n=1 Tax=Gopherus evgoodei TaxID=1825980 RepID=A0A8C4VS31_9SAUR